MKPKKKPAARKPAQLNIRAMDENAWKIFRRKAGAMEHRHAKRLTQRTRRQLDQDLRDAGATE